MPFSTIDSHLLYDTLKRKGIQNFHHANTVNTSLTFISEGALLSRGYVETKGLTQTEQYTDTKDKVLGIWDSVFLDGIDLHRKFARPNKYGPILFYINLDILLTRDFPEVSVTRSNPAKWSSTINNFYESIEDIDRDYLTGDKFKDGQIMFLFDTPEMKISLKKYCSKIVIDDPKMEIIYPNQTQKSICEMVKISTQNALLNAGLKTIKVEIRHTDDEPCNCYHQYKRLYEFDKEKFDKLFKKSTIANA